LDYVFQLKRIKDEIWHPVILLPGSPSEDLVSLIKSLGIELVWEADNSFLNSSVNNKTQSN
jgi:hypothetical protein